MAMIRKQLYIAPEQQRKLRSLAQRWGCTEAEVVRKALDQLPEPDADDSPVIARLRAAGLLVEPPDDIERLTDEELEALEEDLDLLLAETGPLHLAEAVIEDRR